MYGDPHRVTNSVGDSGSTRDGDRFAQALGPEGSGPFKVFNGCDIDVIRNILGRRDQIGLQILSLRLAIGKPVILGQGIAYHHDDTALTLTLIADAVDHRTSSGQELRSQDIHLAGQGVDLYAGDLGDVGVHLVQTDLDLQIRDGHHTLPGGQVQIPPQTRIQVLPGDQLTVADEAVGRMLGRSIADTQELLQIFAEILDRAADDITGHIGGAGRGGRTGVRAQICLAHNHMNLAVRHLQSFRRHHMGSGRQALTYVNHGQVYSEGSVGVELDRASALICHRVAQTVTVVTAGNADAALEPRPLCPLLELLLMGPEPRLRSLLEALLQAVTALM